MAIINTYQNVMGIVQLITRHWPAEQKERLLRELEANPMGSISARPLKQEDQSALFGSTLDNKGE